MSGGFIIEPTSTPNPSRQVEDVVDDRVPLLSLTRGQERKLLVYLDEKLLGLERDDRKHAFISLPRLIDRLIPLIHLILQIPPPEPWGHLRITYLLSLTNLIPGYLTSLPLIPNKTRPTRNQNQIQNQDLDDGGAAIENRLSSHPTKRSPEQQAQINLKRLIRFLGFIDTAWQTVLGGCAWLPPPSRNSSSSSSADSALPSGELGRRRRRENEQQRRQLPPQDEQGEGQGGVEVGEHPSGGGTGTRGFMDNGSGSASHRRRREAYGRSIPIALSTTLDQTQRIRLQSIIQSARAKMTAWSRSYGQFPGEKLPGSENGANDDLKDEGEVEGDELEENGEVDTGNHELGFYGDISTGRDRNGGDTRWEDEVIGWMNGTLAILAEYHEVLP